jgi:gamma-glutamyl:cysteine ligase YbdK (ATP-grasp superfamily)
MNTNTIKKHEEKLKTQADKIRKINEEGIDEVLKSEPIKKTVEKTQKTYEQKHEEKVAKAKAKRQKAIDEWKKSLGNRANSSIVGFTDKDIKFVKDVVASYIEEGVADVEFIVNKVKDIFTNGTGADQQLRVFKETGILIEVVKYIETSFLKT